MGLKEAIQNIWSSDYVQKNPNKAYKVSYADEYAKVAAFINGGAEPNWSGFSKLGKGLCEAEVERRKAGGQTGATGSTGASGATGSTGPTGPATWPASYFTGPAGQGNILPSKKGVLVGAAGSNDPTADSKLVALEQLSGRKMDIEHRYLQNRNTIDYGTGDGDSIAQTVSRGHIPYLSWSLPSQNGGNILRGQHDTDIRQFGSELAAQPHKVFLRFLWEFNGSWYSSSWDSDGTRLTDTEQRDLFRHIVDVLKSVGAHNKASIVWCPGEGNIDGNNPPDWPTLVRQCYPGDNYVDWVGSDGYNFYPGWCGYHYGWCSFKQIFDSDPPDAADTHVSVIEGFPNKPFMVGEVGCREDPATPGRKGQWIKDSGTYIQQSLPSLLAYVWFDMNFDGDDHRIRTSDSSIAGWREMVNRPYFNTRGV